MGAMKLFSSRFNALVTDLPICNPFNRAYQLAANVCVWGGIRKSLTKMQSYELDIVLCQFI